VEIIGGSDVTTWVAKIDGKDQTVKNKGKLEVRPGDRIPWKVTAKKHGVVFADKAAAQAALDFGAGGKELKDQPDFKSPDFPAPWGTDGFGPGTTLTSAKVKGASSKEKDN
jgi:hypothetical protein